MKLPKIPSAIANFDSIWPWKLRSSRPLVARWDRKSLGAHSHVNEAEFYVYFELNLFELVHGSRIEAALSWLGHKWPQFRSGTQIYVLVANRSLIKRYSLCLCDVFASLRTNSRKESQIYGPKFANRVLRDFYRLVDAQLLSKPQISIRNASLEARQARAAANWSRMCMLRTSGSDMQPEICSCRRQNSSFRTLKHWISREFCESQSVNLTIWLNSIAFAFEFCLPNSITSLASKITSLGANDAIANSRPSFPFVSSRPSRASCELPSQINTKQRNWFQWFNSILAKQNKAKFRLTKRNLAAAESNYCTTRVESTWLSSISRPWSSRL